MSAASSAASGVGNSKFSRPGRSKPLALLFQEILTATLRLRSGTDTVVDAETFRANVKRALGTAEAEATQEGYHSEDSRLATFAVVAFLDESALNSTKPTFAEWLHKPLQQELFGHQLAGEVFFENLEQLLLRANSTELADVLEVYYLCLLLGYKGRYSLEEADALEPIVNAVGERIRRTRGPLRGVSEVSLDPALERRKPEFDPWIGRLLVSAVVCLLLAWLLYVVFRNSLSIAPSDFGPAPG